MDAVPSKQIEDFLVGIVTFFSVEPDWGGWSSPTTRKQTDEHTHRHTHTHTSTTTATTPGVRMGSTTVLERCRDLWTMSSQPDSPTAAPRLWETQGQSICFLFLPSHISWRLVISHGRIIAFISLVPSPLTPCSVNFFPHTFFCIFLFLSPSIISFPLAQTPLNYIVVCFFFLLTADFFKKSDLYTLFTHYHFPFFGFFPTQIEIVQAKVTNYHLGMKSNANFFLFFYFNITAFLIYKSYITHFTYLKYIVQWFSHHCNHF